MPPVLVKHLMSKPVVSLFAEQSLPLAGDIMTFKHLRHLPVIDDGGHLIGLVSHRDLLGAQISTLTGLTDADRRATEDRICVREIMTTELWTVEPDALASVAGRTMLDHQYGCLPVVDDHRVLVGIVTESDFLSFAVKTLERRD